MDQGRLEELTTKRQQTGLTPEEANELGRLMAEAAGEPYGNAQDPPPEVAAERDSLVDEPAEEEAREVAEDPDRADEGPAATEPAGPTPSPGSTPVEPTEPYPPERDRAT